MKSMKGFLSVKEFIKSPFQKKYRYIYLLVGIAILSFGLNFYAIAQLGYGNAYYAAAIKSMTQSFHNFFFVSFDPAGMVSVDKPPLALWVQALFVLVFGYHGWAMLLPQALAGTGACLMMYMLVARYFGRPAGLLSALVFALTPAVVVASRNNTMDMQLVFVLLIAVWYLFKGIETAKWRFLFTAALFVGLGFNIKMLQAYMILPSVGIVYLFFSREKIGRRILASAISLMIVAVVSLSWVVAVDLYPSGSRPYIGSSTDNTVMELIVGHNGLERISGGTGNRNGTRGTDGSRGGFQDGDSQSTRNRPAAPNGNKNNGAPPFMGGQNGRTPGGGQTGGMARDGGQTRGAVGNDIGTAGVLRLWTDSMYGQASWLIVLALFGITASMRKWNFKEPDLKQGILLFWIIWLVSMCIFFSFASFYHRYYLCMLAPGIAAPVGIGSAEMYRAFRSKSGWRQWLLPASFLTTFAVEVSYVWNYADLRKWLVPVMVGTGSAALILTAVHFIHPKRPIMSAAAGCMLVALLAAPFYWSLTAVMYVPQNVTMPYAGPELALQEETPGMTPNQETFTVTDSNTLALEKYLVANYKKGSYLVVSQKANDVAAFIVDTGLPAAAYGGFLGSDQALTLDRLKQLVSEGKITYFLVSEQSGFGGSSNSELTSFVKENATLIDPSEYGGKSTQSGSNSTQSTSSLYCFQRS